MSNSDPVGNSGDAAREARALWISELAQAPGDRLESYWAAYAARAAAPSHKRLRGPEIGLVMTRGRAGATGDPFNLGEATATRCAVRLETGEVGHSVSLGRDKVKAERAAVIDALMQTDAEPALRAAVIEPLARERRDRETRAARKAAATRVEFFTMTRGED